MLEDHAIAVVIPAYRAERQIASVLGAMPAYVDRLIIVDDASPDSTADVVVQLRDPRVTLLRHHQNQGVGGAMATGFRAALDGGADFVIKCDSDGQMDPNDIEQLCRPLIDGRADYAKGCRFHHFQQLKSMPSLRLAGNIVLTFLTKMASGYWHVLDPQNGFVAIRSDTLRRLHIGKLARGYFFENDMLIRLNCLEARVIDVPLPSRYADETSSLRPVAVLFQFPLRLLLGFISRIFWRYLFYDVSAVALFLFTGLALLGFGIGFGGYHWIQSAIKHQPTLTGTVILAALPVILGFQLLLQAFVLDIQNSPRPRESPPLTIRGATATGSGTARSLGAKQGSPVPQRPDPNTPARGCPTGRSDIG